MLRSITVFIFVAIFTTPAAYACNCPPPNLASGESRDVDFTLYVYEEWTLNTRRWVPYQVHVYYKLPVIKHTVDGIEYRAEAREYTRICDPNNACEITSDLSAAHVAAIKNVEDTNMADYPGVSRVSDPTIKHNCHAATVGLTDFWISGNAYTLLRFQGYELVEGQETESATKMLHGKNDKHSSYDTYMGTYAPLGSGCNGEPIEPLPTRYVSGKFGFQSKWKTPIHVVYEVYACKASEDDYLKK